jgi:dTMP kinase
MTPFIVFEGIDGSGKSSLSDMTVSLLKDKGFAVKKLREPTSGSVGLKIREILQSPVAPDPDILLQLFVDDRDEDVRFNILPALSSGEIVIMDRYYHSNASYQGASGLSYKRILKTNIERGFPKPDRVYLLDCAPSLALSRVSSRNDAAGKSRDSFEKNEFLADVRRIYQEIADETFFMLDASLPLEENLKVVHDDMIRNLLYE